MGRCNLMPEMLSLSSIAMYLGLQDAEASPDVELGTDSTARFFYKAVRFLRKNGYTTNDVFYIDRTVSAVENHSIISVS